MCLELSGYLPESLPGYGIATTTRIRTGRRYTGLTVIDDDGWGRQCSPLRLNFDLMSTLAEFLNNLKANARFNVERSRKKLVIVKRAYEVLSVKAGSFNGFLRVHSKLDYVEKHLKKRLILIVATWCAQHHIRLAAFKNQSW